MEGETVRQDSDIDIFQLLVELLDLRGREVSPGKDAGGGL